MRLIIKIKPNKPIAYANQILANLISHSGKTLASVKLENRKFKRLRFNLKNASHTDDDFNQQLFLLTTMETSRIFQGKGQRRNGLNFCQMRGISPRNVISAKIMSGESSSSNQTISQIHHL